MGVKEAYKKVWGQFYTPKVKISSLASNGLVNSLVDNSPFEYKFLNSLAIPLHRKQFKRVKNDLFARYTKVLVAWARDGQQLSHWIIDGGKHLTQARSGEDEKRTKKKDDFRAKANAMRIKIDSNPSEVTSKDRKLYNKTYCQGCVERPDWLHRALYQFFDTFNQQHPHINIKVTCEVALGESDPRLARLLQHPTFHFIVADDQDIPLYCTWCASCDGDQVGIS